MKKIFYFIALSLLGMAGAAAQTYESAQLLERCKQELLDISSKQVAIHDIVFNTDGHWLILYGDIGYSYSYIPSPLENMLVKLNSAGTDINKAVLLGDTSWVLLYDGNKYTSQSLPEGLTFDLESITKKDKPFKSVSFSSDKRVTLYGTNGFIAKGIPQRMAAKLAQLNNKKVSIRESAFYGSDGWVLLYGRSGLAFQNLPDDIVAVLQKFAKKGTPVNLVRFYGDKWVVVYDGYKVETNI